MILLIICTFIGIFPNEGANKAVKPVALIVRCLLTVVSVVTRQFGSLSIYLFMLIQNSLASTIQGHKAAWYSDNKMHRNIQKEALDQTWWNVDHGALIRLPNHSKAEGLSSRSSGLQTNNEMTEFKFCRQASKQLYLPN